ncbi:MAG: Type secretory pathway VirD2 pilin (relaxase)-like protein, partial [Bryobacterales bacterium]|nr:Type secretory pathway VirD2 pilin (relaxase)-like protein [Bryobacterales bacterium]
MAKKIKGKRRSDIRTEHEFRPGGLAPRKGYQKDGIAWSGAFRKLMTTMRDTGRRSEARSVRPVRDRIFHQRVAIRVRYSKRGSKGQWKAHGRYIERESAGKGGFNEEGAVKPSKKLNEWQDPGDELMWKIIISPERGNELDLEAFTKDLLAHMDRDLGLQLEWTAAVHTNTAHHHVHLVIRGVDKGGKEVKLPAEYVRQGIRHRAQELATAKLGHRLDYDIILAQMKMVDQTRFTDLDRAILKNVPDGQSYINPTLSTGVQ